MAVNNCGAGTTWNKSIRKFVRLAGNTLCSSLMKIIRCTLTARGRYARYKPPPLSLSLSLFSFLFLLSINIYTTHGVFLRLSICFPWVSPCVASARFAPSLARIKRKIVACFTRYCPRTDVYRVPLISSVAKFVSFRFIGISAGVIFIATWLHWILIYHDWSMDSFVCFFFFSSISSKGI